jgi:Flp pilus assembly protein TadG
MTCLTGGRQRRTRDEHGSMAIEVVVLIPVLFMFTLFVVAGGRYVSARADADSTARDAARAASQSHTREGAAEAVRSAIRDGLRGTRNCEPTGLSGSFASGGTAVVRLNCTVSYKDLGLLGIPGTIAVTAQGHAPIDTYRSTR